MKVDIIGLSAATISFTSLNITIRGCSGDACSIARGIDLVDGAQRNEVSQLERLGLVRVIRHDEDLKPKQAIIPKFEEVPSEEVETPKRGRQRKDQEAVEITSDYLVEQDSGVIVMTETGPRSGKMVHKMNGEIDDNDPRCKASIEAARKMDLDEEDVEAQIVDESLLDPSERMGNSAVIGTGSGESAQVNLSNSVLGSRRQPNFVNSDPDSAVDEVFLELGDKIKGEETNAFIDENFASSDDGLDDAFIEI